MALPQGIAFRSTTGFVTDSSPDDCESSTANTSAGNVSANSYPRTTAQGNTVGWELGTNQLITRDRNAGDGRMAGKHQGNDASFRIDLPSAGDYDIRVACGESSYSTPTVLSLLDTSTSLGSLTTGSTSAGARWKDATDVERTSASDWNTNNASVSKTFATTICRFRMGVTGVSDGTLSFLRVDSAAGGGATQNLAGDAAAAAQAAAQLAIEKALGASAAGAGLATADPLLLKFLLAAASGQAVASGDLGLAKLLAGAATAGASATGQLQGGGTITTPPLKNNTGTVLASESDVTVHVYTAAGAHVVTKTGQTTNGAGVMTINDAALVAATSYRIVIVLASGAEGMDTLLAA